MKTLPKTVLTFWKNYLLSWIEHFALVPFLCLFFSNHVIIKHRFVISLPVSQLQFSFCIFTWHFVIIFSIYEASWVKIEKLLIRLIHWKNTFSSDQNCRKISTYSAILRGRYCVLGILNYIGTTIKQYVKKVRR